MGGIVPQIPLLMPAGQVRLELGERSPQTPLLIWRVFLQNKQKHPNSAWKPLGNQWQHLGTPYHLYLFLTILPAANQGIVVIGSGSDEKYSMKSKKFTFSSVLQNVAYNKKIL